MMSTYSEARVLPYGQRELYQIVADIDAYSSFIPYVQASRVLRHDAQTDGASNRKPWLAGPEGGTVELDAELSIGFAALSEKYTSRVTCSLYDTVTVGRISFYYDRRS